MNDGVEPTSPLFPLCYDLMFNYVCYVYVCACDNVLLSATIVKCFFPHRVKKKKFLRCFYAYVMHV